MLQEGSHRQSLSFAEAFALVLRRGALAALGVVGFYSAVAILLVGGIAVVTPDPRVAYTVAMIVAITGAPLATGGTFAVFAAALRGPPSARAALGEGAGVEPPIFQGFGAVVLLGAGAMVFVDLLDGPRPSRSSGDALAMAAGLLAVGAWLWSRNVVLPVAASAVDRVPGDVAAARGRAVFARARTRHLFLTNAPWLLMAAAIPVGPVQRELEVVLPASFLLAGRVAVTVVLLVVTLMLHAAIAVSVYASARPESG